MDYTKFQLMGDKYITKYGIKGTVFRAGDRVGSGFLVFTMRENKDLVTPGSSVLAQTSTMNREALFTGSSKEPLVGDTITSDKGTWTITKVDAVRPAGVTVIWKLEVT